PRRWRRASLPTPGIRGLLDEFKGFPLRAAAADQKRLTARRLREVGHSCLAAQSCGEDLARHFALGLAAPAGLASERAGKVRVDTDGQDSGSLSLSTHCHTVLHPAGEGKREVDGVNSARVFTTYFGALPESSVAITQQAQWSFGQSPCGRGRRSSEMTSPLAARPAWRPTSEKFTVVIAAPGIACST